MEVEVVLGVSVVGLVSASGSLDVEVRSDLLVAALLVVEVVTDSAGRVLAAVGSVFAVACTKPVEAVSDARLISVYPIQEVVADDAVTSAVADGAVVSKLRDA